MEKRLFYLLNMAQSSLFKHVDAVNKAKIGIPVVQSAALLALEKNDGIPLQELGAILNINKSSVGTLAQRMEHNKIIERKPDKDDARVSRVYITNLGKEKIKLSKTITRQLNQNITKGFNEEDILVVTKFLNHILIYSTEENPKKPGKT